jgi:hypothetical protein
MFQSKMFGFKVSQEHDEIAVIFSLDVKLSGNYPIIAFICFSYYYKAIGCYLKMYLLSIKEIDSIQDI